MTYPALQKSSIPNSQKSLAAFVTKLHAKPGTRGEVISIIRELIDTTDARVAWADIARALARRNADHLIMPARLFWAEYRKFQSAKSPGPQHRRINYG